MDMIEINRLQGQLRERTDLLTSLADALGTGEVGENLVAVARDAHMAEMELAAIKRRMESHLERPNGAFTIIASGTGMVSPLPDDAIRFATRTHAEVWAVLHGMKRFEIVDATTGKSVREERLTGIQTHAAFVKMKELGNSFSRSLADAYFNAEPDDKVRIANTWSEKVRKYHLIASVAKEGG